jgi:hypothetical protein
MKSVPDGKTVVGWLSELVVTVETRYESTTSSNPGLAWNVRCGHARISRGRPIGIDLGAAGDARDPARGRVAQFSNGIIRAGLFGEPSCRGTR